jgi:hypothetical protein
LKVIIAGSRSLNDRPYLIGKAIELSKFVDITEVVSGNAIGIDRLGEEWAKLNGKKVCRFIADWTSYGKAAGIKRNIQMAKYADALLAIWDGSSKGTKHMIEHMRAIGKPVKVVKVNVHAKKTD